MYNENCRGPKTDPCGTPYFTGINYIDSPVSRKILGSTTVLNIDNNQKCFLSSKSAY